MDRGWKHASYRSSRHREYCFLIWSQCFAYSEVRPALVVIAVLLDPFLPSGIKLGWYEQIWTHHSLVLFAGLDRVPLDRVPGN